MTASYYRLGCFRQRLISAEKLVVANLLRNKKSKSMMETIAKRICWWEKEISGSVNIGEMPMTEQIANKIAM